MKVIPEKPELDGAALISARRRSSPKHLEKLLEKLRPHYSDAEIVAAMMASPRLVNAIGKRR